MGFVTRTGLMSVALLAAMLVALDLGRRYGRRWRATRGGREPAAFSTVQGAILGLLGLLVAFSFSGAAQRRALDVAGAGEMDFAHVTLTGRLPAGVRWTGPGSELRQRTFHVRWDASALKPDYELSRYREGDGKTTEERFARELLAQIDAASDPSVRADLERALYHGLDAFKLREVSPAWEEVAG